MAKKVQAYIKLQVPAGQANPSPPVGPALGQHGVNIMEFCKAFNAETQGTEPGLPIPVVITVYSDRSFTFIKKTPPASVLLRKAAKVENHRRSETLLAGFSKSDVMFRRTLTSWCTDSCCQVSWPNLSVRDRRTSLAASKRCCDGGPTKASSNACAQSPRPSDRNSL